MLFYGLACVIGFIIACLYLPALYFAPYGLAGRIARSGATDGEIKREHSKVPERHGDER